MTHTPKSAVEHDVQLSQAQSLRQNGRSAEASAIYQAILALDPDHWESSSALAEIAMNESKFDQVLQLYDDYIARHPEHAEAHYKRANVMNRLGRLEDALGGFDRAIEYDQRHARALCNRGVVLGQLGELSGAIDSFNRALALDPTDCYAWYNRAGILKRLKRDEESLDSYNRALVINEKYFDALVNRGNVLRDLGRKEAALRSYDEALLLGQDQAAAHLGRAFTLKELGNFQQAIASFAAGLRLDPSRADAFEGLGFCLFSIGFIEAAIDAYGRSLALDPSAKYVPGMRRHAQMHICSWEELASNLEELVLGLKAGRPIMPPFTLLSLIDSARLHRTAAEIWVREECPPDNSLGRPPVHPRGERIKIGYFSSDFRAHPVGMLAADLFESHDRSRFEITAFAFGSDLDDPVRARLRQAFHRFIDVEQRSDREVALLARELGIDIAVDLGGFTTNGRTGIFAMRAAPIQVSYLGYLGTLGASYMDYLIADATIIPPANRQNFSEKIIYLPSYQANDSHRPCPEAKVTREQLGLPKNGFVYCCFNANYKITPQIFDVWMRILNRVPGSTLYLYVDNSIARANLQKEASRRAVNETRLVFGERVPFDAYLSRLHAMDLFLDTSPYNAGTTASDALWMGLPVLTVMGEAFCSRMAASLLVSAGINELVASSLREYENTAVKVAIDNAALASIRNKIAAAHRTSRLFDTPRFTRSLEFAYRHAYTRHHDNLPADHIFPESG